MNDYEKEYNDYWKDIIEMDDGSINKDQLMRELSDFSMVIKNVSQVYCELSNGKISKVNTLPSTVLNVIDEEYQKTLDIFDNYQKLLAFVKAVSLEEKCSTANHYYLSCNAGKLLREIVEYETT